MQSRRDIADRAIARARARGLPIDADPQILALIDQWAEGEIDAAEMRRRYCVRLAERAEASRMRPKKQPSNASEADRPVFPLDDTTDTADKPGSQFE